MENIVREFQKACDDPHGCAREIKARGRKVLGFFCTYTPEELIEACGVHPLRIFATGGDTAAADAHLQAYCCSLVRSAVAGMADGTLDHLDGAVFPHTCDTIQRLSDIWRLNTDFAFFADVVLPVKLTTQSSRRYLRDVLEKFRRDLEAGFSRPITDDDLRGSFRTYNTIRSCLGTLHRRHSRGASPLSASDLAVLTKGSMILERVTAAGLLAELVDMHAGVETANTPLKRIMLCGGVCDVPDIHGIIRQAGGEVVWDDLCTGTRYFEGLVGDAADPMDALADRYFDRVICPAKHKSLDARSESILKAVRDHGVQGVVFLHLKFCDPHAFDYPYLREVLDAHAIPSMLLEIESGSAGGAQLLTRFETFMHML